MAPPPARLISDELWCQLLETGVFHLTHDSGYRNELGVAVEASLGGRGEPLSDPVELSSLLQHLVATSTIHTLSTSTQSAVAKTQVALKYVLRKRGRQALTTPSTRPQRQPPRKPQNLQKRVNRLPNPSSGSSTEDKIRSGPSAQRLEFEEQLVAFTAEAKDGPHISPCETGGGLAGQEDEDWDWSLLQTPHEDDDADEDQHTFETDTVASALLTFDQCFGPRMQRAINNALGGLKGKALEGARDSMIGGLVERLLELGGLPSINSRSELIGLLQSQATLIAGLYQHGVPVSVSDREAWRRDLAWRRLSIDTLQRICGLPLERDKSTMYGEELEHDGGDEESSSDSSGDDDDPSSDYEGLRRSRSRGGSTERRACRRRSTRTRAQSRSERGKKQPAGDVMMSREDDDDAETVAMHLEDEDDDDAATVAMEFLDEIKEQAVLTPTVLSKELLLPVDSRHSTDANPEQEQQEGELSWESAAAIFMNLDMDMEAWDPVLTCDAMLHPKAAECPLEPELAACAPRVATDEARSDSTAEHAASVGVLYRQQTPHVSLNGLTASMADRKGEDSERTEEQQSVAFDVDARASVTERADARSFSSPEAPVPSADRGSQLELRASGNEQLQQNQDHAQPAPESTDRQAAAAGGSKRPHDALLEDVQQQLHPGAGKKDLSLTSLPFPNAQPLHRQAAQDPAPKRQRALGDQKTSIRDRPAAVLSSKAEVKPKKVLKRWTEQEVQVLRDAVKKDGREWTRILQLHPNAFHPGRTPFDLYMKYKRLTDK